MRRFQELAFRTASCGARYLREKTMIRSMQVPAVRRQSRRAVPGGLPSRPSRYWTAVCGLGSGVMDCVRRCGSFQPRERPPAMHAMDALARHHPHACMYLGYRW